ncbi:MAG: response regulator [Alphaproteobacteria bacterium]|nr:response regulator [Alphaproteobacteria bacterium]MCW5743982.1 response regulator [Alphaproteobacteria bacterium]
MSASSSAVVLLVEDDAMLRLSLAEVLERLGYVVREAPDGETAQAMLDAGGIDVLFTDIMLGRGINGVELARWTRAHHPATRIAYTTGAWDVSTLTDAPVLRKPYAYKDLAKALRTLLADAR